jgi:uncharacterized protein (DUF362 family)
MLFFSRRGFLRLGAIGALSILAARRSQLLAQTNTYGPGTSWVPTDAPNTPFGTAKGIFPGRVTFIRDPKAARWDGKTGRWWDPENIDENTLQAIFSKSLRGLTGASSDETAWQKLFTFFNQARGRGNIGQRPGETVAIKINVNNTLKYEDADNSIDQSPQATRALLLQLTGPGGVAQKDILVYDASVGWRVRALPDRIYNPLHAEFPDVRWMDGQGLHGREKADWINGSISYTSPETELGSMLPRQVVEATYLINFALLKGHEMSGVTLCGKNHFGSIKFPQKDHPKYVTPANRPTDGYSAYVDLMGSPNLGAKTLLYVVDGLYGMMTNVGAPNPDRDRWKKLFNGEWSSCYFMSQDPVAIDSVCLDFLRSEYPTELGFSGNMHFPLGSIRNCDNYLHEAALGKNAQLGPYKPNGLLIGSQGVHEHWNNAVDRKYSRNLGPEGKGIELFMIPS